MAEVCNLSVNMKLPVLKVLDVFITDLLYRRYNYEANKDNIIICTYIYVYIDQNRHVQCQYKFFIMELHVYDSKEILN